MAESLLYLGGGFILASLLGLVLISFVHNRAVRLTQQRLEAAIPGSMAEVQADKDRLRAEFAMSARQLEMSAEQLKSEATKQLGEIARKAETANQLKAELTEKTAVADEIDGRVKGLSKKIREIEREHVVKASMVDATERQIAIKEAELTKAASDIIEARLLNDAQRIEIPTLKIQIDQHVVQIEELQHEAQDSARRLFDERVTVSNITKEFEERRQVFDVLRMQVAQFEHEVAVHTNELENRAQRIEDLARRINEDERLQVQREAEIGALQQELAANKGEHAAAGQRLSEEKGNLENLLGTTTTTVASYSGRIDELENWVAERDRLLNQRDAEAQALHQEMTGARDQHNVAMERLQSEISSLEQLLQVANDTLEARAAHIADLEKWIAERDELVRQRDTEITALFQEIAAIREEARVEAETLHAEKAQLDGLIQTARDEHGSAQSELTEIRHEAEVSPAVTHDENVQLRERIMDTTARLVSLALATEKSGSIDAILASAASLSPDGFEPSAQDAGAAPPDGSLLLRIRKLKV
jgi:chromosome segregation ATPase